MSDRLAYDALPYGLPRAVRSKLLEYDPKTLVQNERHDKSRAGEAYQGDGVSIPDFTYTSLPSNTKRIRLLRLKPGVLDNPQVDCELFDAEFVPESKAKPDGRFKLVRVLDSIQSTTAPATHEESKNGTSKKGNKSKQPKSEDLAEQSVKEGTEKKKVEVQRVVDEQDAIEYEALSWRWGDEKAGEFAIMIHKDGVLYKKRVSDTLGLALKCLRYEKDRYLWIDAICINQEDADERSTQVSMMSLVYTGAMQVCVWLGEDDDDSTMAFRFIREEIRGLKNFDLLCTDKQYASKWRALLVLMQRPWFSRRWVVQEIVLARGATVYCGPDKIPWRELAIAVELFVEVETATHRLSELMKKDEKFNLIPNWFEHISELGASILVNATAKVFRESKHANTFGAKNLRNTEAMSQRSLLSLEYLVTSLSIFDCGRPHDSVYALVAVARDARPLAPAAINDRTEEALALEICSHYLEEKPYVLDYNRPYADVCKDFVHFCILRCATYDEIQAMNILCRPWAKDWRPGEYDLRENKNDSKGSSITTSRERLFKHEGPWIIEEGPQKKKREDHRGIEQYWEDANRERAIPTVIKQWFPKRTTQSERNQSPVKHESVKARAKKQRRGNAKKATKARGHALDIGAPSNDELALPSWVLRITAAPFDIFPHPGMDMVKMGRKNADPLAGVPQDSYRNYSAGQTKKVDLKTLKFRRRPRCKHYSLYAKGFWFDTVDEVAQVSQGGAIPGTWLDLAGWSTARRPVRPGADSGDPPDEFWRTLVADRGRHDRNPPYYYARACKETIIKGGLRSGAVDTTALIYNERNSIVAEFCRRVQAVIWNRALIKTSKGHLGLVSEKVKAGDKICIIYGCTVPIILRKGNWKTQEELQRENFEDGVEAMKNLMRKFEKKLVRKAQWNKKKAEISKEELDEIRMLRDKVNKILKAESEEDQTHNLQSHISPISNFDNESDDETGPDVGENNDENDDDDDDESVSDEEDRASNTADSGLISHHQGEPSLNADLNGMNEPTETQDDHEIGENHISDDSGTTYPVDETQNQYRDTESATTTTTSLQGAANVVDTTQNGHNDEPLLEHNEDNENQPSGSQRSNSFVNNKLPITRPSAPQRVNTIVRKRDKQGKANERDIYRHYEFLGEAYIHGMMDGEAVRQNFYKEKPDHVFEIR